jgi:thioredoxin-related protein
MKALVMFILITTGISLTAQDVDWYAWNEGKQVALEQEKPMMIFVHASWCHLCQRMKSKVFTDPEIKNLLNKNYIAVILDAEKEEGLYLEGEEISAGKFLSSISGDSFRGIPAFIFVPKKQNRRNHLEAGLKDVEEMKSLLEKYM